ncbi:O-antigen translocase [Luteibacter aegosomaticola]|uniref:O-antigen translocase n=1 Tax=Luteibacter aegosomaticola TaxID=2911538 RepID=UPI001FFBE1ED|nr:O-antigen translocase [Luteibacter aegosomaticola]UPG90941.1 O-antigen translocase [Luteibacter aegosomaticola]
MNIVRAGAWSALGTAARLGAALVLVKLVAATAGPAGVGRLGQFMSLVSILAVLAGGGISAGVVKYVAEYRDDPERLSRLLASALGYAMVASCIMAVAALCFSRPLAVALLGDPAYASLVRLLACAQFGIALANYILAVINGFMDVRRLALVQVLGSFLSVVMALWLAHWLALYGVLLAVVAGQLLWLVVGLPAWWRSPYFRTGMLRMRFDAAMVKRLAAFSAMSLASALLSPLVNIAVRDHLAANFGWDHVGYWQAVTRVSDAYLLFFVTAINIYYLPRLASTHDRTALMDELKAAARVLLPAVVVSALLVYLLRAWITGLLFSADFGPANDLYAAQLVGDVMKIAAFVLSYIMLAKAMTGLYIVSECVFAMSYLGLVYVATAAYGLPGAMIAFALNYLAYLVFNLIVARRYLGGLPA